MYLCYYAGQLIKTPNTSIDFPSLGFKRLYQFKYPMNLFTNIKAGVLAKRTAFLSEVGLEARESASMAI